MSVGIKDRKAMRYKILGLAPILLLATPVFAQEMSPIIIKTGKPVPSVVKSGESFKVTYRAEYIDSVLIMEEHIQPESISADQFVATKLEVITLPSQDDNKLGVIHIQEFTYTFRIIKPEKGLKKIPAFNFIWVEKKAGTTKDETKQTGELQNIPTDEVGVGYISSVIRPPSVNIRDEINFPFFKYNGETLRNTGYATGIVSFLLLLIVIVAWVHFGKTKEAKAGEKTAGETAGTSAVAEVVPNILPKKARKKFLRGLNQLKIQSDDLGKFEKELYTLLRPFILAELSEGSVKASTSDTPNELYTRLLNLEEKPKRGMGRKYLTILSLSKKLRNYYEDMESGKTVYLSDPLTEINWLFNAVEDLSWKKRAWKALQKHVGGNNAG